MEKGGPYPLIILPQFGGYWIEDPENVGTPTSLGSSICEEEEEDGLSPNTFGYKLECKGEARAYRRHFLGKVRPRALGRKEPLEGKCPRGSCPWCPLCYFCLLRAVHFLAACPSYLEKLDWQCTGAGQRQYRAPEKGPCGDLSSRCCGR